MGSLGTGYTSALLRGNRDATHSSKRTRKAAISLIAKLWVRRLFVKRRRRYFVAKCVRGCRGPNAGYSGIRLHRRHLYAVAVGIESVAISFIAAALTPRAIINSWIKATFWR